MNKAWAQPSYIIAFRIEYLTKNRYLGFSLNELYVRAENKQNSPDQFALAQAADLEKVLCFYLK